MSIKESRINDPSPQAFAGKSFGITASRLFAATRPKFYPASVLPVLAGTAYGIQASGRFEWLVFVLALFATVCVHAAANVLNDVGDESGGTDPRNEDRIYPYTGGSRFIQQGIMSAAEMARWGTTLLAVAAIVGLMLMWLKGVMVLYFGLAGVALCVLYSLGPVRLAATGVGETAVAIAFGVLPIAGAAWLQGAPLNASLLLYSLPVSFWVAAILLINEVPDIMADGATGKRTLPVRLGLDGTAVVYFGLHLGAAVATTWLAFTGALPVLAPLVPLLLLAIALKSAMAVRKGVADRAGMTKAIEGTLAIHTIGSIWLVGCALYLHWRG